jgi:YihY family inner membrane protein
LTGEEAWRTLRNERMARLLKDSMQRLRFADGFSHARALAFQTVLAILPGVIVAVGLAVTFESSVSATIRETIDSLAPGPAGELFRSAFDQGAAKGSTSSGRNALIVGGIAMFIAGATAFGQIERAANRIYGVELDRPSVAKYTRASLLTLSAGVLMVGYFVSVTVGREVADSLDDGSSWRTVFGVLRWPVGAALLGGAVAMVMLLCPKRHQPGFSWLAVASLVTVVLSLIVSILFHWYLDLSNSFGDTYGPLAGFIGLMFWTYASAFALLYGIAFAAQLEYVRAGRHAPQSRAKVESSAASSSVPMAG